MQAGRDAIQRRAWNEGADLLHEADAGGELGPEDLELLDSALHWLSREGEWFSTMERAFAKYVEAGEPARAAYVAVALAHESENQLQIGPNDRAEGLQSARNRLLGRLVAELAAAPSRGGGPCPAPLPERRAAPSSA